MNNEITYTVEQGTVKLFLPEIYSIVIGARILEMESKIDFTKVSKVVVDGARLKSINDFSGEIFLLRDRLANKGVTDFELINFSNEAKFVFKQFE